MSPEERAEFNAIRARKHVEYKTNWHRAFAWWPRSIYQGNGERAFVWMSTYYRKYHLVTATKDSFCTDSEETTTTQRSKFVLSAEKLNLEDATADALQRGTPDDWNRTEWDDDTAIRRTYIYKIVRRGFFNEEVLQD